MSFQVPNRKDCENAVGLIHAVNQMYIRESTMTEQVNQWFKDFGFTSARTIIRILMFKWIT